MWINFKKKFKISGFNLTIILSIILFIIYSLKLGKMPSPYFTDEVGYWGCAAFFAGIDWTKVTSKMAYFGYGYGFFLFPLFLLKNSKLIYEGALILNIIFVECVFWMLSYLLNKMFSKQYEIENIFCAFISCLYSTYIVYSHITMSETCILFFVVLLVVLVQKYCEKPKMIYSVLISLVLFELLAIHLRNLIFIAIILLFLSFLMVAKKKNMIITVIFICCAVVLALVGKEYITRNVFTDVVTNAHIDVNDNISNRLWFVNQLFNIGWWKNYFINVLCKSFYLILSSLFTVILAVIGIIKKYKTSANLSEKYFNIFLLILLVCSILYGSLIMFAAGSTFRIDTLFSGRYIECIMPIFCAIGLAYFFRIEKAYQHFKIYFMVTIAVLLISQVALLYYKSNNIVENYANIMPLQITGFSWILKDKPGNIIQMVTLFTVLVYLLFVAIIYFVIKNKYISIATIAACWITFAYIGWDAFGLNLNETTDISTFSRVQRMEKINEVADRIKQLECDEVYYIFNPDSEDPDFYDMFTLQFDLVTVKLLPISSDEIPKESKDSIIVVNCCSDYYKDASNKDEIIYKNDLFIVVNGGEQERNNYEG